MTLDYFYGAQADQFAFYRIPKALFTDERFKSISAEAKILYGILLDRMSLSRKNGWLDEQGRVFIIFTLEEVMEAIGCADQKATKLLNELDSKAGLIERKRQGLGKPNLIFVKNFVDNSAGSISPEPESRIKTRENHDSADVNFTTPESRKSRGSNTDSNNTDLSETETYPFPPGQVGGHGQPPVDKMGRDMDERKQYRAILEDNLEYDILLENNPYDRDIRSWAKTLPLWTNWPCWTAESASCSCAVYARSFRISTTLPNTRITNTCQMRISGMSSTSNAFCPAD